MTSPQRTCCKSNGGANAAGTHNAHPFARDAGLNGRHPVSMRRAADHIALYRQHPPHHVLGHGGTEHAFQGRDEGSLAKWAIVNAGPDALNPTELGAARNDGSQIWWGTHHDFNRGGLDLGIGRDDHCADTVMPTTSRRRSRAPSRQRQQ